MEPTTLTLHTAYRIGEVDPRIFGGFLEHMGRAVYQGVYDPSSAQADAEGFRKDVLAALEPLSMTVMRYPGGNFVSGYHWEDGVGPRDDRPTVRELAWQSIEPNQFGTDEFISLSRKMGWTPMLAVNLGTGSPEEARNWVEYCNGEIGTRYADLRAANGSRELHGVKLWCLGNEMDGPWQLGQVPAPAAPVGSSCPPTWNGTAWCWSTWGISRTT
jgi:alpha-N-arabinofuranosidase